MYLYEQVQRAVKAPKGLQGLVLKERKETRAPQGREAETGLQDHPGPQALRAQTDSQGPQDRRVRWASQGSVGLRG